MTAIILMPDNSHGNPPGGFDPPGLLARFADRVRRVFRRLYDQWRQALLNVAADRRIRTGPPLTAADLDALPVGTRVTTRGGAGYAAKIAAGRWVTDMAAPLTATATSQDIAFAGVTAMHVPARPPTPMPWHTGR